MLAQQERTEALAAALGLREAADDEVAVSQADRLDPVPAAAGPVLRAGALGDDAFEPDATGVVEHVLALQLEVAGEMHPAVLRPAQQLLEFRFALFDRLPAHV